MNADTTGMKNALSGFIAFYDPPKETAGPAIAALLRHGVEVKILTGDNELVAAKVCRDVGLDASRTLVGSMVEAMSDSELEQAVAETTLFARLTPSQKARIIRALKGGGRTVGFLGDGINDALNKITDRIAGLPALSGLLEEGGAEGVIRELFGDIPYTVLESHDIFFRCGCGQEKVERALLTLGSEELRDMRSKESGARVTCEFCRKAYHLGATELDGLIVQASERSGR